MLEQVYSIVDFFSLDILVKTWAAPWKNDVQAARNTALQDQVKLWEANLTSRIIGSVIRTFVIVAALIIIALVSILGLASLAIWILLPVLIIGLPIIGLTI